MYVRGDRREEDRVRDVRLGAMADLLHAPCTYGGERSNGKGYGNRKDDVHGC